MEENRNIVPIKYIYFFVFLLKLFKHFYTTRKNQYINFLSFFLISRLRQRLVPLSSFAHSRTQPRAEQWSSNELHILMDHFMEILLVTGRQLLYDMAESQIYSIKLLSILKVSLPVENCKKVRVTSNVLVLLELCSSHFIFHFFLLTCLHSIWCYAGNSGCLSQYSGLLPCSGHGRCDWGARR